MVWTCWKDGRNLYPKQFWFTIHEAKWTLEDLQIDRLIEGDFNMDSTGEGGAIRLILTVVQ
jgi:hypothetical protein